MHSERDTTRDTSTSEKLGVSPVIVVNAEDFKTPFRITVESALNYLWDKAQIDGVNNEHGEELVRIMVKTYLGELYTRGYRLYSQEELKNGLFLQL
jgi:hypothetical protein